eukprot:3086600-Prymnesium_polylepis.2
MLDSTELTARRCNGQRTGTTAGEDTSPHSRHPPPKQADAFTHTRNTTSRQRKRRVGLTRKRE